MPDTPGKAVLQTALAPDVSMVALLTQDGSMATLLTPRRPPARRPPPAVS